MITIDYMGRAKTVWNPLNKLRSQRCHDLKAKENHCCKKNSRNNVFLQKQVHSNVIGVYYSHTPSQNKADNVSAAWRNQELP